MIIIQTVKNFPPGPRKVCIAIGVFDGVHLGHQQVIRQMVTDAEQQEARSVVITFDRHPNAIVAPDRVPPLIYSLSQKMRAIENLEAETTFLVHFDEAFSKQSGEQFVRRLAEDFGEIKSICVGASFTFGRQRSGNVALLKTLGKDLGFVVHGLAAVSLDGEVVSSTRIREAIREGQLDLAGQMLGRGYALGGRVVRGDQLGRQLGFPTANLDAAGLILPPAGVYAVHINTHFPLQLFSGSESLRGDARPLYRGVLNVGYRPTLAMATPQLRVEAHIFDFSGDLYGAELEITIVEKIRDEKRFPSLDDLKLQIAHDVASARNRFDQRSSP